MQHHEKLTIAICRQLFIDICQLIDQWMPEIKQQGEQVTVKEDGSLVTTADVMVEQRLQQFIVEQLGDVTFVGEETFNFQVMNEQTETTVILDPIDGTENFCMGLPEWGVAISIWQDGNHIGSLLYMPELGKRLMTGDVLEQVAVPSRMTALSVAVNEQLLHILKGSGQYRMSGCSVYNLYYVITGSFTSFVHPKGAYVWDILAGMLLALEYGCDVYVDEQRFEGEWLDPTKRHRLQIIRQEKGGL